MKTVRFGSPKYVGDPINAVKIFNEKQVDELIVLDIDATARKAEPDYARIKHLAAECRMPLCYGGGVTTVDQFQRLVALGVEKVAVSAAAVRQPQLIAQAASRVGSQSVTVVMDIKKIAGLYKLCILNGTQIIEESPVAFAKRMTELGAGEIVVNNIDCDGTMKGYDLELIAEIRASTKLPMTVIGGAGSLSDIAKVIRSFGLIGAAAGSLFVFKGVYRAVLINYPSATDKDVLFLRGSN